MRVSDEEAHHCPNHLDLKAHPLPHHGLHEAPSDPYQAWRLLHFNPQHLNILFTNKGVINQRKPSWTFYRKYQHPFDTHVSGSP